MSFDPVYRAPMRSRRDDIPEFSAVARALKHQLVGVGGRLGPLLDAWQRRWLLSPDSTTNGSPAVWTGSHPPLTVPTCGRETLTTTCGWGDSRVPGATTPAGKRTTSTLFMCGRATGSVRRCHDG